MEGEIRGKARRGMRERDKTRRWGEGGEGREGEDLAPMITQPYICTAVLRNQISPSPLSKMVLGIPYIGLHHQQG